MDETDVTRWIVQLKAGDSHAAQKLWEAYFAKVVQLARRRLQDSPRRAADEEDLALSAFKSFCLGAEQGRFPDLVDRDGLWSLLVAITANKAIDAQRRESRQKRGGGLTVQPLSDGLSGELSEIIGREPTPEFAAQVAEQCEQLLERLADPELAQIAILKMQGFSVDEIGQQLDCASRTVKRKLQRIRTIWLDPETNVD